MPQVVALVGMDILYTAVAHATGERRNGDVRSDDGVLDMDLRIPKEMGGPVAQILDPRKLFAAGYAAWLPTPLLKFVVLADKLDVTDSEVSLDRWHRTGAGRFRARASSPDEPASDPRRGNGEDLSSRRRTRVCPYSNATRGAST